MLTLYWVNHVLPSQNKEHCIVLYCTNMSLQRVVQTTAEMVMVDKGPHSKCRCAPIPVVQLY